MKQYSFLMESKFPIEDKIYQLECFYKNCDYGTVLNGKRYTGENFNYHIIDKCHILTINELKKYKCGMCYDTVGYSHYWLTKWNIPHKIFIGTTRKEYNSQKGIWDDPTHTFLIYQNNDDNGNWWWLEGSWSKFKDNELREVDPMLLVRYIRTYLRHTNGPTIYIKELKKYPKLGLSIHEFYKQMMQIGNNVL